MRRMGFVLLMALWVWPGPAGAEKKEKKAQQQESLEAKASQALNEAVQKADAKAAAGEIDAAIAILKDVAEKSPSALIRIGQLLEKKTELDTALDTYKAAAEKLSGSQKGEALGRMSLVQEIRALGDPVATAEAAAAEDSQGLWPTIALARARAKQQKGDEALALAQKAVAAGGGAAAATALGFAQEARGDEAAAIAAFREALGAEPGRLDASLGLARTLGKAGQSAEAEAILNKTIDAAPGFVGAYKERARLKLALGQPDQAMPDASTAAALDERDAEAQQLLEQVSVARALAYLKAGQVDLAIEDLTAYCAQNPKSAAGRIGMGRALLAKRPPQVEAAAAELNQAIELDPKNAEACFQMGLLQHLQKKSAAGAVPFYEKAVELDPANTLYLTNLGAVLSELGQLDRAVEVLNKAVQGPGANRADAWVYLGGAQLAAKRYPEAIGALEKAVALAPNEKMAYGYMAWAYLGLKDAANFKRVGAKARELKYNDTEFLKRLQAVEAGQKIR